MVDSGSQTLRELTRALVRNLSILEIRDASCCGVTVAQCHVIVEIGRKGRMSLVGLAGLFGLDRSTTSRKMNSLVEADLISWDLDIQNRGYVIIQLTEKGKALFNHIEGSREDYFQKIFGSIPQSKRTQVLESTTLLMDAVRSNKCC